MKAMLDFVARHKAGEALGITSICSAHPLVIEAAFVQALKKKSRLILIEATCNQVNQDGGYTGMLPTDFVDFVYHIADKVGFDRKHILLGGDHLGPNPWTRLSAKEAMQKAEVLIEQFVVAGFRKIHVDCSMSCIDDPTPLSEEIIASRAIHLIAIAEKIQQRVGSELPVYVIGTEVPVPGGASENLSELQVTTPEAAITTIEMHNRILVQLNLTPVLQRIIATVVQPGVEFDHHKIIDYNRLKAKSLSQVLDRLPTLVYEAHSTDYQTPKALKHLVEDHFAILKVGPALTFALREALWALDAIEREWIAPDKQSNFRHVVLGCMQADSRHWAKYYHTTGADLQFDLQYSFSDRIRYYWPDDHIQHAQNILFNNLITSPPPLALLSQYLPEAYANLRKDMDLTPKNLIIAHIGTVIDTYLTACTATLELTDA
jgi:D-tagatose-1,6-bisphosphate aldolase subunit GatZ/KbaZ